MTTPNPIIERLEAGDPITQSWLGRLVDQVNSNAGHGGGSQSISTGIGTLHRVPEGRQRHIFRIDTGETLAAAVNSLTSPSTAEGNIIVPDEDNPSTASAPGQMKELTDQTYTLVNRSRHLSAQAGSTVLAETVNGEWLVTSVLES